MSFRARLKMVRNGAVFGIEATGGELTGFNEAEWEEEHWIEN